MSAKMTEDTLVQRTTVDTPPGKLNCGILDFGFLNMNFFGWPEED
jgi:hypothetical protein